MNLKGSRYPKALILLSVHWYLKYPLSYQNLKEMLGERGMGPDHSSVYRWVKTFTSELVRKSTSGDGSAAMGVRQCKYLNNTAEQDPRFIKKRTRTRLESKTFNSAQVVLAGIEVVHRTRKGQLAPSGLGALKTTAEQFYQLVA